MSFESSSPLESLIKQLASLPGLGGRSARRIALHLLTKKESHMLPLARAIDVAAAAMKTCAACGNMDATDPCGICRDDKRDGTTLCVVAGVADVWAMERGGHYRGRYHILGGVLSALDGIGPEDLHIEKLTDRIKTQKIEEIILALSVTVEGQSTAHYIMDHLHDLPVRVTRLAHGVPVGGELDYLDDNTIAAALKARAQVG